MIEWHDDVFVGYQAHTIDLQDEDDGELVSTLVRRQTVAGSNTCVIYVHGFSDYFFQQHLADSYVGAGIDFYAVDRRRCGRSLRPGNRDNFIDNIGDYGAELAEAVRIARDVDGHNFVILHGHSEGGLVCAIFVATHPAGARVDLLALNSPWLDVKLPFVQGLIWRIASYVGQFFRHREIQGGPSAYVDSIHSDFKGEWEFDLTWKPRSDTVIYVGWSRAVARGHAKVQRGLGISIPILVQHSDRSTNNDTWHDDMLETDSVLDVGPDRGSSSQTRHRCDHPGHRQRHA